MDTFTPSPDHVADLMKAGYTIEQVAAAYKIRETLQAAPKACPIRGICHLSNTYPEILEDPIQSARYLGAIIGEHGTLMGRVGKLVGYKRSNKNMYLSAAVTLLLGEDPFEE